MAQHLSGPASLEGQVALFTGGAGGMGRAIAQAFNAAGARVVATDRAEHEDIGPGIAAAATCPRAPTPTRSSTP
jgi:NAD(P)-dependent dehydrogenase (short-subunit alcohol dehydrogenase family)